MTSMNLNKIILIATMSYEGGGETLNKNWFIIEILKYNSNFP